MRPRQLRALGAQGRSSSEVVSQAPGPVSLKRTPSGVFLESRAPHFPPCLCLLWVGACCPQSLSTAPGSVPWAWSNGKGEGCTYCSRGLLRSRFTCSAWWASNKAFSFCEKGGDMLAHRCLLGLGLLRGHGCGGHDGGSSFAIPAPVILRGRFRLCDLPLEGQRPDPPQLSWPRLGQPQLIEACLPHQRGLQGSNSRTPLPAMRATLGKPWHLAQYLLFAAPGPGGLAEP